MKTINDINRRGAIIGMLSIAAGAALNGILDNPVLAHTAGTPQHSGKYEETENFKVLNSGIGGNNTADLLKRIKKDCLDHKPKLTVLMVGTNDMNSAKHIPLPAYEQNLRDIVRQIKATKSKVLLMTILPCYEPDLLTRHPASFYAPEGVEGRRKQINSVVKKIASDERTFLLDLEHIFLAVGKIGESKDSLIRNMANFNSRDGIHPTGNGYRFIGLAVYDFITFHKLPASGIVCFGDSITRGDGKIDGENYPAYLLKLLSTT